MYVSVPSLESSLHFSPVMIPFVISLLWTSSSSCFHSQVSKPSVPSIRHSLGLECGQGICPHLFPFLTAPKSLHFTFQRVQMLSQSGGSVCSFFLLLSEINCSWMLCKCLGLFPGFRKKPAPGLSQCLKQSAEEKSVSSPLNEEYLLKRSFP